MLLLGLTAVPELPKLDPVLRTPAFGLLFCGQRTIAAAFVVGDGTCGRLSQLSSEPCSEGGIQCGTFGADSGASAHLNTTYNLASASLSKSEPTIAVALAPPGLVERRFLPLAQVAAQLL